VHDDSCARGSLQQESPSGLVDDNRAASRDILHKGVGEADMLGDPRITDVPQALVDVLDTRAIKRRHRRTQGGKSINCDIELIRNPYIVLICKGKVL
jgi:hypothetical protein